MNRVGAGAQTKTLPIPDKFAPGVGTGARSNQAFESLTLTPDSQVLWTAVENALVQDGGKPTIVDSSPSRMIQYHTPRAKAMQEVVYVVEPIPVPPVPPATFADNGLVDLAGLDNGGTPLAMERSFAVGANTVKIFEVLTDDASDVSGYGDGLPAGYVPVDRRLIVNIGDLARPDNLEGMTLGPKLPDGRQSLILVSDNNFNPGQITQFILLSLDIEPVSD